MSPTQRSQPSTWSPLYKNCNHTNRFSESKYVHTYVYTYICIKKCIVASVHASSTQAVGSKYVHTQTLYAYVRTYLCTQAICLPQFTPSVKYHVKQVVAMSLTTPSTHILVCTGILQNDSCQSAPKVFSVLSGECCLL